MTDYSDEDVGNVILLEHVNVQVPDQAMAILFYIVGIGLTRDPYLNVGLTNMWANAGEQQFHLPTRSAQVIHGHIGLVVPDLKALKERLESVKAGLAGTRFSWSEESGHLAVRCPWGNQFRCYAPGPEFGDMALGIPYVEFLVAPHRARGIGSFYERAFGAPATVVSERGLSVGRVAIGRHQALVFRESDEPAGEFDGHHIAVYVANFSGPYGYLKSRGLLTEDVRNHQFRFQQVVDPESGAGLFALEHEVRSLRHPMFHRTFVNRDPRESTRNYRRGRDALVPYCD